MSKSRSDGAADSAARAANEASEAGRILQAQRTAVAAGADIPEPRSHTEPRPDSEVQSQLDKARENHPHKLTMEEIRRKREGQEGSLENAAKNAPAAPPAKAKVAPAEPVVEPAVEPAAAVDPAAEPSDEAVVDPAAAPATPAVPMVKVKVDGVESEVSQAEVEEYGGVRPYQIAKANERALKANAESLAETKRIQAAMAQMLQAQANPPVAKPTTDQILAKLAANRFGTDEEFAANLREFITVAAPPVNQNMVVLQATSEMRRSQAQEQFNNEFQDITSNQDLKTLVGFKEQQALAPYVQQGQVNWQALAALDWQNFYRTIGNQVRSVTGQRQSQPPQAAAAPAGTAVATTGTPSQASEKEARKASIVTLPTASARAELSKESKPETREESLNRMRKTRGQPTQ